MMKLKHLLILLGIVICTTILRWFEVPPFSYKPSPSTNDKLDQQSDLKIPTPDQLWEQQQKRSIDHTQQTASTLVPQRLLELEAKGKEQAVWERGYVDENDIPPANPDIPYSGEIQQFIPATEPEMEVLPPELIEAERQLITNQNKGEIIIPSIVDPAELLQPGEIPPEPPEMEALPEELMNLEYASGNQ